MPGGLMKTTEYGATRLLTAKDVAGILSVSLRHLWRLDAEHRLPKPVRMGKCVRWLADDIEQWLRIGCPSRAVFERRRKEKGERR